MQNKNKNKSSPTSAQALAALSAMLAFSVCPTQAFEPTFLAPTARLTHRNPWSSSAVRPAPVTMNTAPRDTGGNVPQRQPQRQHPFHAPALFAPPDWYQAANIQRQQQLQMGDPTVVQDTDDHYTLSFALPPEVDHDGLQVSVSGRLLTVKARITREEEHGPSSSRGGWITRSSRTESVSRSFVLPEGVLASSANTSLSADGKVEVKFNKEKPTAGKMKQPATASTALSTSHSAAAAAAETPTATAAAPATPADSTGSSSATGPTANTAPTTTGSPAVADRTPSSPADAAQAGNAERPPTHPESTFEALDKEFRNFAEAMWGDYMLPRPQVPTEEEREKQAAQAREWWAKRETELARRAKAAMDARAKRVTAMRRATMAADISVSEDGSSYLVKFALPEGMTRDNVDLTVSPDRSLRVTISAPAANGASGHSVYKDVLLPKDAILSDISAKFKAEPQEEHEGNVKKGDAAAEGEGASADVGGPGMVSGLEVTVGKAAPPQPKSVDIV